MSLGLVSHELHEGHSETSRQLNTNINLGN